MAALAGGKGRIRIAGGLAWRAASAVSVLLAASPRAVAESPFYLNPSDRVVFYGGAPPLGRPETALIETYVATRFPQMGVEFLHRGWDGRWSRPGSQDRSPAREVIGSRPTVLVLGAAPEANDGSANLTDYLAPYTDLVHKLREAIPDLRITVVPPEPRGGLHGDAGPAPSDGFFQALARDQNLRVHKPEAIPPGADSAAILKPAVDLLKSWNAPATVSVVEINAPGKSVSRSENTTVRNLEAERVVAWSEDDATLPLAPELSAAGGPALQQLNIQLLRVIGLLAGRYKLTIDGWLMGTFDRDDFERGIDLTKLSTPMLKQASDVFNLTLNHIDIAYALWERAQAANDPAVQQLERADADALERRRIVGEPRTHDYEIIPLQ